MQVRRIAPEEMLEVKKLEALCFLYPIDVEATQKRLTERPELSNYANVWACFTDEGQLASSLENWPLHMHYDGGVVGMGGVGAVFSAPEARMQGGMRAVLHTMLEDDRAQGRVFSVLFPFSHVYYRKFGYELCHEGRLARFPTSLLRKYALNARVRMHRPEEGDTPFRPIYDALAQQYTYCVARDDYAWRARMNGDVYKMEAFRYILSREGSDVAYVMFKPAADKRTGERTMHIYDYAYVDIDALHSLLGFLYTLDAQLRHIRMELPDGFEMSALLDEPYDLEIVDLKRTMARVVNVEAALRAMRHPDRGSGAYSLWVQDDFLPENTGAYHVAYGPQGTSVRRASENACDLSISVQTFAQLCLGYMPLEMALYKQDVRLLENRQTLADVFVRKRGFLMDRF